ncbi:MAG: hypothetical protein KDC66_21665 [Phaeodactylibacter sp.]|nr:hypothetical protein [Phaeodactylibacter sp.]MCB9274283.1 hypothetical protein [Lewinellaceae bacterium]
MMHKSFRYPGAQPFKMSQEGLFFGREQDIENLYQLLTLERLIVLYSKSGLGKSSLINAGIMPRLVESVELRAFPIRFGAYQDGKTPPLNLTRGILALEEEGIHPLLEKAFYNDSSLWFHLKNWQLHHGQSRFILIIDQFEELFTYPEQDIIAFKRQVADLLHTEMPNDFREQLEAHFDDAGKSIFSDQELELLHHPLEIKLLLAIRSDRMSLMNNLSDYLPNVLRTCYELNALNLQQAEEAILNPAYLSSEAFSSPPFDYEDEAIEAILSFLSRGRREPIESFQLQILCQSLEQRVIDEGIKVIKVEHLQNIGSIYEDYYDTQIARLNDPAEQLAARQLIEEALIFEEEERRLSLYEGQVYQSFGFTPELLRKLVDLHLLRAEPSLKGGYTYEIPHDTLVQPILKAKSRRLEQQRRQEEEAAKAEREQELSALRRKAEEEQRKKARARAAATAFGLLALLALVASVVAARQYRMAKASEQEAIREKERSVALSDSLEQQLYRMVITDYERLLAEARRLSAEASFGESASRYRDALASIAGFGIRIDSGGVRANRELAETEALAQKYSDFSRLISEGDALAGQGPGKLRPALEKYQAARALDFSPSLNQAAEVKAEKMRLDIEENFSRYKERGLLYLRRKNVEAACQNLRIARSLKPADQEVREALAGNCQ